MSTKLELVAESREQFGKGNIRRMRRLHNGTPAIVYGGEKDPVAIQFPSHTIAHELKNEALYSNIITIKIGKKSEKVILKAIQRHPSTNVILHLDFFRINEKQKLTIKVPLHFVNEQEAPGIKEGCVALYSMNDVEVSCLPSDIPEEGIEVDLSEMQKGDVLHTSNLKLPAGVELTSEEDAPIVSITEPRAAVEEAAEEGEAAEGEEGAEEPKEDEGSSEDSE